MGKLANTDKHSPVVETSQSNPEQLNQKPPQYPGQINSLEEADRNRDRTFTTRNTNRRRQERDSPVQVGLFWGGGRLRRRPLFGRCTRLRTSLTCASVVPNATMLWPSGNSFM